MRSAAVRISHMIRHTSSNIITKKLLNVKQLYPAVRQYRLVHTPLVRRLQIHYLEIRAECWLNGWMDGKHAVHALCRALLPLQSAAAVAAGRWCTAQVWGRTMKNSSPSSFCIGIAGEFSCLKIAIHLSTYIELYIASDVITLTPRLSTILLRI